MKKRTTKTKRRLERACPWAAEVIDANLLSTRVQAAAVSLRPKRWNKAYNADRMEKFFRRAARQGAQLIVAPEGMLEGYVVSDVTWHRERVAGLLDIAEPIDGPYMRRYEAAKRALNSDVP
mgnify:CR=1 FL=1